MDNLQESYLTSNEDEESFTTNFYSIHPNTKMLKSADITNPQIVYKRVSVN